MISDNGTEPASNAILGWSQDCSVAWQHIQPGNRTQNAFAESFLGRPRDELPNETPVRSPDHARRLSDAWRADLDTAWPHSRLGWLPPNEHARRLREALEPGPDRAPDDQRIPVSAG